MKFTQSLKFKLTVWYSVILSVFCIAFVLSINLWLTEYMETWSPNGSQGFLIERVDRPRLRALSDEQRELVMESRLKDLENIREFSIYMIFPLVLLSFGGGYLIATVMLRPLDRLNSEIRRKEANNLNEVIDFNDNGDEISELIKSFNRMSSRLGNSFESQKQFVENASHEIKTPLSVMQANLDTVLQDDSISKKEIKELLSNAKKQVKVMDHLTEDLLLLSMISSNVRIEMEEILLNDVISEMLDTLKSMAKGKGIEMKFLVKKEFRVLGNKVLLGRAISNVVENSIKYSGGSSIKIRLEEKEGHIRLVIEDDGNGIPKDMADMVFDRFYRVDKGRSRKEGGSGLGLSISRDIIDTHNGNISIDKGYRKGARFIIDLKAS